VYGSPRKERAPESPFQERWNYIRQAVAYLLWAAGLGV